MNTRLSRRFRPVNMNGCVLYLPFYSYGANAQKIWDISGQGNHGTINGAVPFPSPMLHPQEKVTNGTFTGDTGWTKGTGWAITTVATKTAGTASDLEQDISAVAAERYHLVYTLTRTAGALTPQIGAVNGTARTATGCYREIITATGTGNLKFQGDASFAGTIDDVSVKKVTGHEGVGWYLDGVDDTITVTSNDGLNPGTGDFTAAIWFKTFQNDARQYGLFHKLTASASNGWRIRPAAGKVSFFVTNQTNSRNLNSSAILCDGKWHCYVGRHDFDAISVIDVDGNIADASATNDFGSEAVTCVNDVTLGIWGANPYFNAWIGEALYFNRFLSAAESRSLYQLTRAKYGV